MATSKDVSTPLRRSITPIVQCILFVLVLLAYPGLIVFQAESNSPVVSEDAHLSSGAAQHEFSRFDLYRVNPPLVRHVAAYPVRNEVSEEAVWRRYSTNPLKRSEFAVAADTFHRSNRLRRHVVIARITVACVFCITGVLMCVFWRPSLSLLALLCFSPNLLGHGSTIFNDAPSAFTAVAAVYFLSLWLEDSRLLFLFAAGVMLGLTELCKFTLLVFYPLFIVMWILYRLPERKEMTQKKWALQGVQLAGIFLVSVFVINCGYLFEGTFKPLREFQFQTTVFTGCETLDEIPHGGANRFDGSRSGVETLLGHVPMPLPANMIQGIDTQRYDFERGLPSYLRGENANHGWWYYYLYALLVKMPLGTWGLLGTAIVCTLFLKGYNAPWRDEMMIILPGLTLFVFVSSQTGFSVHSRYIIPALPFLFIWISKVGQAFTSEVKERNPRSTKYVRALVVFFLTWMIASSLWVYPHSLSYFNELAIVLPTPHDDEYPLPLPSSGSEDASMWQRAQYVLDAGPRNGPRHLLDSNIDWGQDLFYLEDWCESDPEASPIRVAYWGSYPLELSKVDSEGRPPFEPTPGWYALSVNELYGRSDQYRYFLHFEPMDMAGYSIYIYHVTLEDANRVRRELGLPELTEEVESGETSGMREECEYDSES